MTTESKVSPGQHIVPAGYLKYFSPTQDWSARRGTQIYEFDGKHCELKAVRRLACPDFGYTKVDLDFDKAFHRLENEYPRIAGRIISGEKPTPREGLILAEFLIDLYARNGAYEIRNDDERKTTYKNIRRYLFGLLFGGYPPDWILWAHWELTLLIAPESVPLITSDHPVKMFTILSAPAKNQKPVMFAAPIHPGAVLAFFDKTQVSVPTTHISEASAYTLNELQIAYRIRHVFSPVDLTNMRERWAEIFAAERPQRYVDNDTYVADVVPLSKLPLDSLDFVSIEPKIPQGKPMPVRMVQIPIDVFSSGRRGKDKNSTEGSD